MKRHRREVHNHYFEVQKTNQINKSLSDTTTELLQLIHQQLDEKERVIEQKKQAVKDSDDLTEVSSWLDRTQWIRHLEGQDKATVAKLVNQAGDKELELQYVEKSLVRLVEKARQTILQKKVSTFMLHRVENFHAGEDSHKPFHVNLMLETIKRYQRRVKEVLQAANQAIQFEEEELEETKVEIINGELDKSCLELCIALLDHRLDHNEYESAVLSYMAIAGLEYIPGSQPSWYKFKDSAQCTPLLSGFIKVAQMLTVQYCLEKENRGEVESCRELLEQLHTRFLVVGTATPMDWVIRLRLYGRAVGNKTTAVGSINWVGEKVIYREIELGMSDLRQLVYELCEQTRDILFNDLLFIQGMEGDLPSYCWSELKDNPAKDDPG
ncbi:hypothetical protein FGG08_005512, partial [Glutinoglossum americanum]